VASKDLLEAILGTDPTELNAARARVLASKGKGDINLVADVEKEVKRALQSSISFDPTDLATVEAGDQRYCGGRFATPSIGELEASVIKRAAKGSPTPTISVIEGRDPVTDIGALQAMAPASTLFQVASQFNCLEAPGPRLVDVADYLYDRTQGPRAALSAFPATLVRHYAAPDGRGGRFTQSLTHQIDLLAEALPADLGRVKNGYLQASRIRDLGVAAAAVEQNFNQIRVGVHDDAQVVLGYSRDGVVEGEPRIAQVFTSTLATGGYGQGEAIAGPAEALCRQLLRAAYLGTLLAAVDLGKKRVPLTMIGGGVFGNPHELIVDSIVWAVDQVTALGSGPLTVVLNGRDLSQSVDRAWLRDECARRGGVYRKL